MVIKISDKFDMHYVTEEDAPWLQKIGKYNSSYNERANPSRFAVIFSENGVNLLWLGLSANSGKIIVTGAVTDPSLRNTGVLKEVGAAAIAWLETSKLHEKLVIPIKNEYDCLFEGFDKGTVAVDGMRSDIKVL